MGLIMKFKVVEPLVCYLFSLMLK
uniref:Uncharacterized protein n=1 Tax=Rhizophora mucronata TaxID=61149 RepID=A0A2P2MR15_RHIMU